MSKVNQKMAEGEKPIHQVLAEKREAQEADAAMLKEAPPEPGDDVVQTPGAVQTHPLEEAAPYMEAVMSKMEQTRQVLANQYNAIKKVKETGDTSHLLDQDLSVNPEAWSKKEKEFTSLMNKLLTILPTV